MPSTNILAIETSTSDCSVALQTADGHCKEITRSGNNIHSQVVLPIVQELLDDANLKLTDLDAIGVCRGPGSFTGLRIGIGVAQGLAYGAGLPMFGFSSLDVLVYQQTLTQYAQANSHVVLAMLDARMQEVYWAAYGFGGKQAKTNSSIVFGDLKVTKPRQIEIPTELDLAGSLERGNVTLLGNAWLVYPELRDTLGLPDTLMPNADSASLLYPLASGLIKLFNQIENQSTVLEQAKDFAPLYVRNNVATKPTPSLKSGSAVIS